MTNCSPSLKCSTVQGHTVLGVEGVPFVVEQFFRESKLEFDKVAMPQINGWRFRVRSYR